MYLISKRIFLILVVLFLSACSQVENLPIITASPVILPVTSPTPTSKPFQPVITPIFIPNGSIIQACITPSKDQQNLVAEGTLVFETFDLTTFESNFFIYDFDLERADPFPYVKDLMELLDVSPDRKTLLYTYRDEITRETLVTLVDYQGKTLKSFPYPKSSGFWDDLSWFAPGVLRGVQDLFNGSMRLYRYEIETGKYDELRTDWPNAYKGRKLDWGIDKQAIEVFSSAGANMIYDPTLTYLLYPQKGEKISLIQVENGRELATTQLPSWGRLPRWSANGQNLVLIGGVEDDSSTAIKSAIPDPSKLSDEFFIVSKDGKKFRQLTSLFKKFNQISIDEYAWSPDGTRIVFWINPKDSETTLDGKTSKLMLLDIKTGGIADLCIKGISKRFNQTEDLIHMIHPEPFWSPDGTQIMVTQLDSDANTKFNVLIIDLASKSAYKVVENLEPIGWMTKEP